MKTRPTTVEFTNDGKPGIKDQLALLKGRRIIAARLLAVLNGMALEGRLRLRR